MCIIIYLPKVRSTIFSTIFWCSVEAFVATVNLDSVRIGDVTGDKAIFFKANMMLD